MNLKPRTSDLGPRTSDFLAWALILFLFALGAARAEQLMPTSPAEIAALREELLARQRQREDAAEAAPTLGPWQPMTAESGVLAPRRAAGVRLVNDMPLFRAIWTFEPVQPDPDKGDVQSLRVLLCWKGEQWLTLAPGRWRVGLTAGWPDDDHPLQLPVQLVTARAGRLYEMVLTGADEQTLRSKSQAQRKSPAPGQAAKGTGQEKEPGGKPLTAKKRMQRFFHWKK